MYILSGITQEVKDIFSDVVNGVSGSAETLEVEVLKASRELGRRILEACLSEAASEVVSPLEVCEVCSGELVGFQKRKRYVETLCGVVKVGCLYRDYPQLGQGAIPSARSSSLRYVASQMITLLDTELTIRYNNTCHERNRTSNYRIKGDVSGGNRSRACGGRGTDR